MSKTAKINLFIAVDLIILITAALFLYRVFLNPKPDYSNYTKNVQVGDFLQYKASLDEETMQSVYEVEKLTENRYSILDTSGQGESFDVYETYMGMTKKYNKKYTARVLFLQDQNGYIREVDVTFPNADSSNRDEIKNQLEQYLAIFEQTDKTNQWVKEATQQYYALTESDNIFTVYVYDQLEETRLNFIEDAESVCDRSLYSEEIQNLIWEDVHTAVEAIKSARDESSMTQAMDTLRETIDGYQTSEEETQAKAEEAQAKAEEEARNKETADTILSLVSQIQSGDYAAVESYFNESGRLDGHYLIENEKIVSEFSGTQGIIYDTDEGIYYGEVGNGNQREGAGTQFSLYGYGVCYVVTVNDWQDNQPYGTFSYTSYLNGDRSQLITKSGQYVHGLENGTITANYDGYTMTYECNEGAAQSLGVEDGLQIFAKVETSQGSAWFGMEDISQMGIRSPFK